MEGVWLTHAWLDLSRGLKGAGGWMDGWMDERLPVDVCTSVQLGYRHGDGLYKRRGRPQTT